MTIEFDLPEHYNDDLADEGVWFEVYDHNSDHWGDFKLRFTGRQTPESRKLGQQLKVKYAKDVRMNRIEAKEDDIELEIFLALALVDWRGIKAGGKEVAYNFKNVEAYFAEDKVRQFVYPLLRNYSNDPAHYGADKPEDVVGNS